MRMKLAMLGAASVLALASAGHALAGDIQGRVTEATRAYALEGAIIRVAETGQTVTSDEAGEFRFGGLPAGQYTLEVSYLGAEVETVVVEITNETETVDTVIAVGLDVPLRDNILVIGQRGALTSALNRERAADGIVSVLSADAIGRMPDENVAEAARRAVGVNVLNDQGEGRFVSIRGIDPNLNTVSIGGVRAPSPEADARQVPLDVVDADILSGIVVTKSLTPDMDGDSVGGNIEIETLNGLDQQEFFLRARAAGIYSELQEEWGYRGSFAAAGRLSPTVGFAGSIAYQNRDFGSDNMEVDGAWDLGETVPFPEEFELRDYTLTRERLSIALNLDFEPNDEDHFFLRTLYSDFSDQEYRQRIENGFERGEYNTPASSGTRFLVDGTNSDEFRVDRDLKDRYEDQVIWTALVGGEHFRGPWSFDYALSYAYAEEAEPNRLDTTWRAEFDFGSFGLDIADRATPTLIFGDAASSNAYYDPANYEFDGLELTNGLSRDFEWAGEFNFRREATLFGHPGYVQAGVRGRLRNKSYDLDLEVYDGFTAPAGFTGDDDLPLTDFLGTVNYGLDTFGPGANPDMVRNFFFANRNAFDLHAEDTLIESTAADYTADEDVFAYYAMASVDVNELRIVGGVRIEQTEYDARGNQTLFVEDGATYNGQVINGDTLFVTPTQATNDYTDVLPSVNFRYAFEDNLVGRAAYYASISRPSIEAAAPRVFIEQDDNNDVAAEYGNPDLDRAQAHNFDVSLAWYPNRDSVLMGGVFFKRIDNLVAEIETQNVIVNNIQIDEGATWINLPEADLFGIELNYQQALTFLPGPFDGLIVGANYTFVDSEVTLPTGRSIPLPNQSQNVWNVIVGYDDGPWDVRAALSYRDEYLATIDEGGAGVDRFYTDHLGVDFSAEYDFTEQFRGFLEFKNISDEPFYAVQRYAAGDYNAQYEEYGWSAQFGFRFTR
ncbi:MULTISPECIES: TonB-dependent receptor [Hyphobacterium]|uniref:TonB-dependent receptor n=1 Tax=Hyphobacterium vulgare TaxID=1736751 RepID=A0ABV6ZZ53_9PROT